MIKRIKPPVSFVAVALAIATAVPASPAQADEPAVCTYSRTELSLEMGLVNTVALPTEGMAGYTLLVLPEPTTTTKVAAGVLFADLLGRALPIFRCTPSRSAGLLGLDDLIVFAAHDLAYAFLNNLVGMVERGELTLRETITRFARLMVDHPAETRGMLLEVSSEVPASGTLDRARTNYIEARD